MVKLLASKIHLYAGLALGIVVVVLSVTGSALVFREPLEQMLRPDLHQVAPQEQRMSLDKLAAKVYDAYPQYTVTMVALAQRRDAPLQFWMTGEAERHTYVNPYTGDILGSPEVNSGFTGSLFVLHVELMAGPFGAWFVGVCGLLLVLLSATGLVLWWPRLSALGRSLAVVMRLGWKRANYDLHRAAGFWTTAFVLVVALTGSGLYFYDETGDFLYRVTRSKPPPPPPQIEAPFNASLQKALQTAGHALPGAVPTYVYLPVTNGQPLTVRMRAAGEWHPVGRSFAYLHPNTGGVLRVDDARAAPLGSRLLYLLYPLHIGSYGGPVVRWLYMLLGLMPTVPAVSGTIIWYNRLRKKTNGVAASNGPAVPTRPARPPPALMKEDGLYN